MAQTNSAGAVPRPNVQTRGRHRRVVVALALLTIAAVASAIVVNRGDAPGAEMGVGAPPDSRTAISHTDPDVQAKLEAVLEKTRHLDQTVWAKEVEAQQHEEYFIALWDDFRAARDKLAVLERAPFGALTFATPGSTSEHDWDVTVVTHDGERRTVDSSGWRALLARLRDAGYRPTELEFHQSSFEHEPGQPARSAVATVLHVVNVEEPRRLALRAKLLVEWGAEPGAGGTFIPHKIEATEITVAERPGEPAFGPVVLPGGSERGFPGREHSQFVLVYDLDGDGRSEILVPGDNVLMRNHGGWRFEPEPMLPNGAEGVEGAVIADFDGDALPDLLCARGENLYLARGVAGGRFSPDPPEQAASLDFKVLTVTALTAGDIDGDGDLDAWMGQYKRPYAGGQLPTPYYDANDGYPAALLVNDGTGHFTDATEAAGLANKRFRRTFAGSLIDLDGDRDLDLLVNSDFAGLDIYFNDGAGKFTDVTEQVIEDRHNFGMGHTFADFNLDGRLDLYTIGMSSTTARRLTAMGAGLKEFPDIQEKRPQMGYGNRMFLAPPPDQGPPPDDGLSSAAVPRYVQPPFRDEVARTGWSWGTAAADFDNDGDPDIFVTNGHASGKTCRDYCTKYWRRDVYLSSSKEDPVLQSLFAADGPKADESWNGFEHDVLYMNEGGKGFLNVAHLLGVAFEFDGRNVVADDLDGDGRMDLLVVEKLLPRGRYLHVLRNDWPTNHNWVGVRLAEGSAGYSPYGAEIRVRTARGLQVARIVTGDSFQSQHANAKHFGLGGDDAVESIEVAWPNGEVTRVESPPVNQWHDVRPD